MQDSQPDEQVLKITHDSRSKIGRGHGRGHGRQSLNKVIVECFRCHKLGHFQYECPQVEKQVHYSMYEESSRVEDEVLLVAYEETNHQSVQQEDWFLDSGCSNHMTGNKRWFTKIHKQGLCKTVKLGNDTTMAVEAKGDIRVCINGCSYTITDVYYVPELRTNLLSLGQLGCIDSSNYAGDLDDRRRTTSRAVFIIGSGAVSWASKKQSIVRLSTTEAEYIAAAACACQCIWLHRILEHVGIERKESITILCDNNSTIQLSKNPVFHGRSKHIAVKFHFLRDLVNDHVVQLKYCNTQEQVADIMTKAVKLEQFEKLRQMLGVVDITTVS
uniref:Retrovirus-related Pol polyprotein from transposon TNT 1-94 n=1 Tax=Cajanus cajan TaxID=3821 RepID=A0A151RCI8_CAJCA|nr:Retrovirus-related Pol polyprotein from transposon TNT 1-94 [Cajanus cajan]